MAKYSKEFKLMVVKEYKEGSLGHKLLAKKHGVKAYSQIKRWIDVYEKFGEEGLKRKIHKETYSVQFKLDVLSFMKRTGSSETETALHFGLANPPIIGSWKKAFLEGGTEALDRPKGRPSMSDKAKNGNYKKTTEENKMTYEQKLERENELLRLEVEYLKKVAGFSDESGGLSRKAQAALSFELKETFKLKDVLQIVGIPESSYHYHIKNMNMDNPDQELVEIIQSIFEEHNGNYGYRRIHLELKNRGIKANHKKVQRIMNERGLKGDKFRLKSRKYSSYKGSMGTVAKNLINRRFNTNVCHQKLTTDITEFKCSDSVKLYLSPIMDMFNGEILSYGMSMRPTLELALKPLEEALESVKDSKFRTTVHSDQGWHYQHNKWVKTLKENKVFQSMSRKGNCLDNSPMENFFGLLKQEMYYGEALCSYEELKKRIEEYINYYNNKRIKQKLAGMSPVQYRIHTSQLAA